MEADSPNEPTFKEARLVKFEDVYVVLVNDNKVTKTDRITQMCIHRCHSVLESTHTDLALQFSFLQ